MLDSHLVSSHSVSSHSRLATFYDSRDSIRVSAVIQECANAINAGSTLEDLAMMTHTHPTLCEVLDEAFKGGLGRSAH